MNKINYQNDLTFDEKVMIAVVRAAECFKRSQSSIFRKYDLSFPQYNILRVLAASDNGQNKISAVGKIMLTPGANMTGLAKRLERNKFIERKADPNDERVTLLVITGKGQHLLELIEKEKDGAIDRILDGLSKNNKTDLLKNLGKIIKSATDLSKEKENTVSR